MKRQICSLAFSAMLVAGLSLAAPQDNSAPPPPPQAQGRAQHGPMDPNQQLARMTKQLKLTSDQQNQILPILTNRQQQFEAIRNDNSLSQADQRAKMRSLREDSEVKIKAVLNDDQKKHYDTMQQRSRERMRDNRESQQGSNPGAGPSN